ncbi:hypothetical protein BDP27DRAFT_1416534 [Rhodocollybia butyracea]|uniref:F-box domain-containing protein n=1 Tax=Rhodocollybia butyracea TaxID=206335 RepID=A0A9P5PX85_9AGAR|nr:hypothetical protein BDP27DRAFT_1416534 [Rhodocollybia butyracea]
MHLLALPNEVLIIILNHLHDDKYALASAARLQKRIRRLSYLVLYRTVNSSALKTLSTYTTISGELHPTTYVKNLVIDNFDFQRIFEDNYIEKHMVKTIQNIGKNPNKNYRLSRLVFKSCTLPLSTVIGYNIPAALLSLKCVDLRSPFPQDTVRLCTSIYNKLCSAVLTQLTLDFSGISVRPDYTTISKILRPLPCSSPHLELLDLKLATTLSERPTKLLQHLFDDEKFTFFQLNKFSFEATDETFHLKAFLLRHPYLRKVAYRLIHSEFMQNSEKSVISDLADPAILPYITDFTGSLINALVLCSNDDIRRPLRRLTGLPPSRYQEYNQVLPSVITLWVSSGSDYTVAADPLLQEYLHELYSTIFANLIHVKFIEISVNHSDEPFLVQRHVDAIARAIVFTDEILNAPFDILVKCNLTAKPMVEFTYG